MISHDQGEEVWWGRVKDLAQASGLNLQALFDHNYHNISALSATRFLPIAHIYHADAIAKAQGYIPTYNMIG